MQSERYSPSPSDTLQSLLNTKYPLFSKSDKKNIALNILFANPQLALRLLPSKFWASPSSFSSEDAEKILDQRFGGSISGLDIPTNASFVPEFRSFDYAHRYDFASVINNQSEENKHYLVSEKSLKKIGTSLVTTIRKSAWNALLQDSEVTGVGAVAFFSNMSVAFPKILTYLGAKFQVKTIEGEKFFLVYGSKKIHGEMEILLQGLENDARIISVGFGSAAAKRIMKTGTPMSIVIVAGLDVVKYAFKKQETMADLLTEIAVDIPQAAAVTAGGALVSWAVVALPIEGILIPILLFGGAIVVVGAVVALSAGIILDTAGYNSNNIHKFVVKHHIDVFVTKTWNAWEKLNYDRMTGKTLGPKF